jgi:hypothetical protein
MITDEEVHLQNILKILQINDYDEIIAHYLYVYCYWKKLLPVDISYDRREIENVKEILKS